MFLRKQEGFTLIELLIVIVILGVLAAMAVPRFAQTSEEARNQACRGNLSAIENATDLAVFENPTLVVTSVNQLVTLQYIKRNLACPLNKAAYTFTNNDVACPNDTGVPGEHNLLQQ